MKTKSLLPLVLACFALFIPSAQASQPPLNVDVVNTPNVNVANTPTVTVGNFPGTQTVSGSVNVVNTTANPVPVIGTVQDADNPARQAVQVVANAGMSDGNSASQLNFDVPAGKIFVIEFASFEAQLPPSQTLQQVRIRVAGTVIIGGTGIVGLYEIPVTGRGTAVTGTLFTGSQQMRLYAPSGNGNLQIEASRDASSSSSSIVVSLSGYLVNAQ